MQKMTLARALRYKKRVIEAIRKLEEDVIAHNSRPEAGLVEVDVPAAVKRRAALVGHLVDLKLAVQEATRPVQRVVLELAETKAEIAFWNKVPTTRGVQRLGYDAATPVAYWADITKTARDATTQKLQEKIDALQTTLDNHNAGTFLEVDVPT